MFFVARQARDDMVYGRSNGNFSRPFHASLPSGESLAALEVERGERFASGSRCILLLCLFRIAEH